jgi:hypothetical protein
MPNPVVAEPPARAPDPVLGAEPRTPGSAFVLPANPLHNLSDESLEGFVDCTLYEETANFFDPAASGGEWNDELAEPPVARSTDASSPASVPAMPYDTPPNLMVRHSGTTESLAVAPDEPPPQGESQVPRPFTVTPTTALFGPLHDEGATSAAPWLEAASATYGAGFAPETPQPSAMPVHDHVAMAAIPAYPPIDAGQQSYAFPPAAEPMRATPQWQRWLLITGTTVAAIVLVFVVARMVRGSHRAEPPAVATGAVTIEPRATPALADSSSRQAGSGSEASQAAGRERRPAGAAAAPAAEPIASGDSPAGAVVSDEDGETASGGAPVVGSGPCRVTVATTPAGSIIRFDDQAMGPSPITIEGTCDKHKVDASHARYQSMTKWVTLASDKPKELDISLPRPIHSVTVTSFPPGAELSIDGHRAGTTPTVVQMMGFARVNLTFTKAGFRTVTTKVYSKLPQDRVFVKLVR